MMLARPAKGETTMATSERGVRPLVRSFVLISRLLIKPRPPKKKKNRGEKRRENRARRRSSICYAARCVTNGDRNAAEGLGRAGGETEWKETEGDGRV